MWTAILRPYWLCLSHQQNNTPDSIEVVKGLSISLRRSAYLLLVPRVQIPPGSSSVESTWEVENEILWQPYLHAYPVDT
jgi:hypothetical protein